MAFYLVNLISSSNSKKDSLIGYWEYLKKRKND
jgi:hypothetical protein